MVILNEQHWIARKPHFFEDRVCEFDIGLAVVVPIGSSKQRSSVRNVAERPEAFIRKTVVVAFLFFFRQPDTAQHVLGLLWRNRQSIIGVTRFLISITTAVCDPSSFTSSQNWL